MGRQALIACINEFETSTSLPLWRRVRQKALIPLLARNRHSEAELLYRQVLQQQQRVLGPEHPDTIASINNLAVCINAKGRWAGSDAAAYGWG